MTTPIIGAPEWAAAQDSPWLIENKSSRMIEAMAARGIVEDRNLSAPPGACSDGARYLIDSGASGLWATHSGEMAIAVGANAVNGWYFVAVAKEGNQLYVKDEDVTIQYDGAAWNTAPGSVSNLNDLSDVSITTPNDGDLLYYDLTNNIWFNGPATVLPTQYYRIGFFFTTAPTASEVLAIHVVTDDFTIPANFASPDSKGSVGINPAGSFAIDVQLNGVTIGTITISTGGAFTFATTSGTAKSIVAGDVLKFVAPGTPDASIANVAITVRGVS